MAFGIGDILGAVAGPLIGGLMGGDAQTYSPYGGQPLYQPSQQPAIDRALVANMQNYASAIGAPGQPFGYGGTGYSVQQPQAMSYDQWASTQPQGQPDLRSAADVWNWAEKGYPGRGSTGPTQSGYQQYLQGLQGQGVTGTGVGVGGGVTGGGYYGSMLPYAQQLFQQQYNNPYATGYQQAANLAGLESGSLAGQYLGGAQNLMGAGNQLYQTGFDPQQALYNRLQQQNMEQQNAIAAQRGVAMSPYGAGLAQQANQNFNIDWQNQQLNRQLEAARGMTGAYTGGTVLGGAGINAQIGAGQLPYQAQQGITGGQQQAMQNYYGNIQPYFGAMTDLANQQRAYLGLGQTASQNALSAAQQQNAINQANAYGISSGITSALKAVPSDAWSNLFGGGGSPNTLTGDVYGQQLANMQNLGFQENAPYYPFQ